jgi:hypothetical protein
MHLFRVGSPHEGGVPKEPPELLMKSFNGALIQVVVFMTSKNDPQQRDETLFAIKFRRAELTFPERSADDRFRNRLMLAILPLGKEKPLS